MAGARIFFSYPHRDEAALALLEPVRAGLQKAGFQVLLDEGIRGGDRWSDALYQWLLGCSGAVVFASPPARTSEWCQREWHVLAARESAGARVVPVLIGTSSKELGALAHCQGLRADAPDLVDRIVASFAGLESTSVSADDVLAMHGSWLRWQYRQGQVLGKEPFTLADVYIETECGCMPWEIGGQRGSVKDPFDEQNGGREGLLEKTMSLLSDPSFNDVVVVQGPPGCGKSAFTLHLANHLLDSPAGLAPVLVRFRDMRLASHTRVDELLADALRVGPESEPTLLPETPLLSEDRLRRTKRLGQAEISGTVVILDGWDEVSLAGSASYKAQLSTWLPKIRQYFLERTGRPVRLVVTGRPSLEVKESGFLRKQTPVLTVRPIRPQQLESFATKLCRAWRTGTSLPASTFERYARWYENRKETGAEVLGQPLLALLAVRVLSRHAGDPDRLLGAPTALYKALVDQTVPLASKVEGGKEGTVHRGGDSLRRLLRKTAATISIFLAERISFEELEARLGEEAALADWVDQATREHPLSALVVNFWFKGGHRELGCEFLHKSFREYLYAEEILDGLLRLSETWQQPLPPPNLPYWQDFPEGSIQFDASRVLARLLAPRWLTPEVRAHLFWLIEATIQKEPDRWVFVRDLLTDVYGWWAEGVHLRHQGRKQYGQTRWDPPFIDELTIWAMPFKEPSDPRRTATLDAQLGDALLQLTAFVYSLLLEKGSAIFADPRSFDPVKGRPFQLVSRETNEVRFGPGGSGFFRNLVARIATGARRPEGPELSDTYLADIVLVGESMEGISARRVVLAGARLHIFASRADFSSADLTGVFVTHSDLAGALFHGAVLGHTGFIRCSFARSSFREAVLGDHLSITHSLLNGADFNHYGDARFDADLRWDFTGSNYELAIGLEDAPIVDNLAGSKRKMPPVEKNARRRKKAGARGRKPAKPSRPTA